MRDERAAKKSVSQSPLVAEHFVKVADVLLLLIIHLRLVDYIFMQTLVAVFVVIVRDAEVGGQRGGAVGLNNRLTTFLLLAAVGLRRLALEVFAVRIAPQPLLFLD